MDSSDSSMDSEDKCIYLKRIKYSSVRHHSFLTEV